MCHVANRKFEPQINACMAQPHHAVRLINLEAKSSMSQKECPIRAHRPREE